MSVIENIHGKTIFSCRTSKAKTNTIAILLQLAVKAKVNLHYADLRDTNLQGADLQCADAK